MVHCSRSPDVSAPVHLTLFVPQLFWPEPDDQIALQGLSPGKLNALLARGRASHQAAKPYEAALAELFGLDAAAPYGALRLAGELLQPADPDACWLCADPVHLRFHHERIVLADASAFPLEMGEAQHIATDLNRNFPELGQFHVAHPQRWYLRLHREVAGDPSIAPLSAIAGRRIDGNLPQSEFAAQLTRWQNEIQIFLHHHPVNLARSNAGHPAVNGVWFWGPGRQPALTTRPFHTVWTGSPLAAGLARLAGLKVAPPPPDLAAVLAHAMPRSRVMVMLEDLIAPVLHDDGKAWRHALEQLEARWFAPLLSATRVHQLDLIAPTIFGQLQWTLTATDRWKLWRRPTSLPKRIHHLASQPPSA